MVTYVDNENFNVLCSLVVRFGESMWMFYDEATEVESYAYHTPDETIKKIREDED